MAEIFYFEKHLLYGNGIIVNRYTGNGKAIHIIASGGDKRVVALHSKVESLNTF